MPAANGSQPVTAGKFSYRRYTIMNTSKKHAAGAGGNGASSSVPDAADIEALWLDPALGDGIVNVTYHTVPIGKPKFFFRTVKDPTYRRRTEIVTIKQDGVIDDQHYIVAPTMRGQIAEAYPCTIVTIVDRAGSPYLWPIKFPRDGERDNDAWISARAAAKAGMEKWVKIVWVKRTYQTREAEPGYAPDPDFSKLPPYNELVRLAFGDHGVIRDKSHAVYRDLYGIKSESTTCTAGDLDDL
jgi:hypothetical protein